MHALRSHIALLLLLCLTRTLLPEAWILALHSHAHTTVEPAHAPADAHQGKALMSAEHKHCQVEHFYNAAFEAAVPVRVPVPRELPGYAALAAALAVRPPAGLPTWACALRGPPSRA